MVIIFFSIASILQTLYFLNSWWTVTHCNNFPQIDFWIKLLFFRVLFILPEVNIRYSKDPNGTNDAEFNSKRGIYAALFFWVSAGMTIMPDGPFLRPHPLIWRAAFAFSIVYELFLIYTLFQVSLKYFIFLL